MLLVVTCATRPVCMPPRWRRRAGGKRWGGGEAGVRRVGQVAKILVTGSSDGIGKETAGELARQGHEVIVHGRTRARATGVVPGARIWACDFASLDEVRSAAAELPSGIDVLINNAGVYRTERELTRDGHERTFQVNHLAPSLLTNLLLPSLSEGSRIVNVSSQLHARGEMSWDDLSGARESSGSRADSQA